MADESQTLIWSLLRVTMPMLIFVVIFLTMVLVVGTSLWLAGLVAGAVAVGDFLLFHMLSKRAQEKE